MTDKEKIRAEIERLKHESAIDSDRQGERGLHCASLTSFGKERACRELLSFIDSMREEPKKCMYALDDFNDEDRKVTCDGCEENCKYAKLNTMLDDALSKETKESWNERLGISQEEYGKVVDECIYGKEPELVDDGDLPKEEPVSNSDWLTELQEKLDNATSEQLEELWNKYNGVDEEEPVSEELEKAMQHNAPDNIGIDDLLYWRNGFITGAKWQKEKEYTCYEEAFEDGAKWKVENLWKPADDDDLPEIDREVIALLDNGKVVFAHRPPEYWDGKNIATGKVTRYCPKTYDKGGWNIPDVKWWLDCLLPNMED